MVFLWSASLIFFKDSRRIIYYLRQGKLLFKEPKKLTATQGFLFSALRGNDDHDYTVLWRSIGHFSESNWPSLEANFKLAKKQIELGLKAGADLYWGRIHNVYGTNWNVTQSEKSTLQAAKSFLDSGNDLENATPFNLALYSLALAEIELETAVL